MILTCSLSARGEVHVAASQALAAAVNKPQPEYNSLARQMKVTGDVAVEVRIAPSGAVDQVKALSGNALLSSGVVRTLKKWRFKPFEQDGKPAVAVTTLRFNFKGH
ncbi:MAG: energy transducer TonB [Bryobacteraceae bacterium]